MVRNIVLFSGTSHPDLTEAICTHLGIGPAKIHLSKFSVGETRVEIGESVREKDVYIVQTGAGRVNDNLMELLITISACKTASAKKVTAVLPLFPYSRQSDLPYNKVGAPLARMPAKVGAGGEKYPFSDSRPGTPSGVGDGNGSGSAGLVRKLNGLSVGGREKKEREGNGETTAAGVSGGGGRREPKRKDTLDSVQSDFSVTSSYFDEQQQQQQQTSAPTSSPPPGSTSTHTHHANQTNNNATSSTTTSTAIAPPEFRPQRGYKQWVAQAGTLVADLLTCAGADHIITMDLHDPQYQGFFDIPVDNLYGRHLLRKYIQREILPKHASPEECVIVSPDAGGAKRATNIADSLGMDFALIHKERRPTQSHTRQNASLLLVGAVAGRTAILIDDLADTSNTITRAAKLLKRNGAHSVIALVTHGVFSGDAIDRINASCLDKVVVTDSVPQEEHVRRCEKLEVLQVAGVFAEAIRRVHHGESISVLFQYD